MKRMMLLAAFCAAAFAAPAEREKIWPDGRMPDAQPHQIAAMTDEKEKGKDPYLDWCPAPANPNGCCMILISGGGYQNCCDVGLVKMWEKKFTEKGFRCVNFVYRTPRPNGLPIHQSAWEDGQRAVRMVRSEAAKRGFDPEKIGTVSMSAGSHLATLLATSALTPAYEKVDEVDDLPCHINWAITGAIAYAVTDGIGTPNTRNGQAADAKLDAIFRFDGKTAPMCMFHGSADDYSPMASTLVYRELRKRKVPAELHLFADRRHGGEGHPDLHREELSRRLSGDQGLRRARGRLHGCRHRRDDPHDGGRHARRGGRGGQQVAGPRRTGLHARRLLRLVDEGRQGRHILP